MGHLGSNIEILSQFLFLRYHVHEQSATNTYVQTRTHTQIHTYMVAQAEMHYGSIRREQLVNLNERKYCSVVLFIKLWLSCRGYLNQFKLECNERNFTWAIVPPTDSLLFLGEAKACGMVHWAGWKNSCTFSSGSVNSLAVWKTYKRIENCFENSLKFFILTGYLESNCVYFMSFY